MISPGQRYLYDDAERSTRELADEIRKNSQNHSAASLLVYAQARVGLIIDLLNDIQALGQHSEYLKEPK